MDPLNKGLVSAILRSWTLGTLINNYLPLYINRIRMFVCMFVCLFVCLFVCWIYLRDRASFDTRVVHGKKRNLSAEVPIEKLTPSHQRFFLYE